MREGKRSVTATTQESPLGRRERKKRELRRRIFDAAFSLFVERGFDQTTVEDIADRADVGKGTVFNYFPRKSSFLAAVAEDWLSRIAEDLGPVEEWPGSTREQLERGFNYVADLATRNPAISRLAFTESLRYMYLPPSGPPLREEPPVRRMLDVAEQVVRLGQVRGEVRSDVEPRQAAALIESSFFRTLAHWLQRGGPVADVRAEMAAKLDIIFEGIAP
jgi:AcrR family transcriptional regulator